ncbi:MAG: radical SAM protein [Oligoflexia bacterium]|nr:radical SAM protein [Oligoflexia bacterium]
MEDIKNWFKEFYIHESCWDLDISKKVRSFLNINPIKVSSRPYSNISGNLSGQEFDISKQRLYLTRHEGHFFRKCPGTQGAACCNYFVLNLGQQCNMNCSYCYLQSYINSPLTQIYTNIDEALMELEGISRQFPDAPFRVGTGEVVDSLSLDDLTQTSSLLVNWFSKHPKLTLEFKTKSNNVKNFVNLNHAGNVVVSFSINPEVIVNSEEHRTASLQQRLVAARLCADKGFPVAFHIDPMIYVPDWEMHYTSLVNVLTSMFTPREVKWISVGALRFIPEMKNILRERFGGKTSVLEAELFKSHDGKLRYDQRLRNKMFKHVVDEFKKADLKYPVFLCMESHESWLGTFETSPRKIAGIESFFKPLPTVST